METSAAEVKAVLDLRVQIMSLQEHLESERRKSADLEDHIKVLESGIKDLQDNKTQVCLELASVRESCDHQILQLKRKLEVTDESSRGSNLSALGPTHSASSDLSISELTSLLDSNRSMSLALLHAQTFKHELDRMNLVNQEQLTAMNVLKAKLDNHDYLKAEYERVLEDNERLKRLVDSISREYVSEPKRPKVESAAATAASQLWSFKKETKQYLERLLNGIESVVGWGIQITDDKMVLRRGDVMLEVEDGKVTSESLPPGFPDLQDGVPIAEVLALLVLISGTKRA